MASPSDPALPFWQTRRLDEMTAGQWESLCDGCGKCCLAKLEDEDTGEFHYTSIACRLFDTDSCTCRDYANRAGEVPDCVQLTPANVPEIPWLPKTCAYRLIAEGKPLPFWHPLVSGTRDSVHRYGVSVGTLVTALETDIENLEDYLDHILDEEP